ncbi:hypothetical protein [Parasulfitobacter algicola]|uniref:Uncharacterized protein n=1 Tax=Parasulfitobacter algicola TaxID=2614809 RepID=A0ABX2ITV1_9RHOB|nr:hypothetical protein [Sulfitobacter algicola]NSX56352.1 hypothetical protein [Sulfitobacter algicola]
MTKLINLMGVARRLRDVSTNEDRAFEESEPLITRDELKKLFAVELEDTPQEMIKKSARFGIRARKQKI